MKKVSKLLVLILSVSILTPLANDMFIPSLPRIASVFHTHNTQFLISVYMLGLALSQLFYGPFLDRFGRKPILIIGLSIFVLASIVAVQASTFNMLLISRFFQAVGVCCTRPSAMAILRDILPHDKLLKAVSYLMGAVVIAPVLAPVIGSYLQITFDWRGSFMLLLILGIVYWLIITIFFKETLVKKNLKALNFLRIIRVYRSLLSHRNYVGFMLAIAFGYAAIFAYIATAPFLLIHTLNIPVKDFGWYFLLFAVMISLMAFIMPHFASKLELHFVLIFGMLLFLMATILLFVCNVYFKPNVWLIIGPMMLAGAGVGIIRPSATTALMKLVPANLAGTSGALSNAVFSLFGTISTGFMAMVNNTILTFSLVMLTLSVLGLISCVLTLKISSPLFFDD